MVKCDLCKEKVQKTFLGKLLGTFIKSSDGVQKVVCSSCQRSFSSSLRDELDK